MSFKEVFKDRSQFLEAERNKEILFKEINRGYLEPLDRTVFKKSAEERFKLFLIKQEWKNLEKLKYSK